MQYVTQVDMSRHVKLVADKSIQDAAQETYDAIALPVRISPDPLNLHTRCDTALWQAV